MKFIRNHLPSTYSKAALSLFDSRMKRRGGVLEEKEEEEEGGC